MFPPFDVPERIVIPANIGFEKNENNETLFLHPIHTYDNSGRIHVETMKNATAELGFFFDIWGVDFSEKRILGNDVDDQYTIEITVNNQIVNTSQTQIAMGNNNKESGNFFEAYNLARYTV